jgi:hypothetical protein
MRYFLCYKDENFKAYYRVHPDGKTHDILHAGKWAHWGINWEGFAGAIELTEEEMFLEMV